jgi:hypothetical protein
VVDEQLGAAVEEVGERFRSALRLERVLLVDPNPRQLTPLLRELVAAARELLLFLQKRLALGLPLLQRRDPVRAHWFASLPVPYSS